MTYSPENFNIDFQITFSYQTWKFNQTFKLPNEAEMMTWLRWWHRIDCVYLTITAFRLIINKYILSVFFSRFKYAHAEGEGFVCLCRKTSTASERKRKLFMSVYSLYRKYTWEEKCLKNGAIQTHFSDKARSCEQETAEGKENALTAVSSSCPCRNPCSTVCSRAKNDINL